jgi:hypothetical protein
MAQVQLFTKVRLQFQPTTDVLSITKRGSKRSFNGKDLTSAMTMFNPEQDSSNCFPWYLSTNARRLLETLICGFTVWDNALPRHAPCLDVFRDLCASAPQRKRAVNFEVYIVQDFEVAYAQSAIGNEVKVRVVNTTIHGNKEIAGPVSGDNGFIAFTDLRSVYHSFTFGAFPLPRGRNLCMYRGYGVAVSDDVLTEAVNVSLMYPRLFQCMQGDEPIDVNAMSKTLNWGEDVFAAAVPFLNCARDGRSAVLEAVQGNPIPLASLFMIWPYLASAYKSLLPFANMSDDEKLAQMGEARHYGRTLMLRDDDTPRFSTSIFYPPPVMAKEIGELMIAAQREVMTLDKYNVVIFRYDQRENGEPGQIKTNAPVTGKYHKWYDYAITEAIVDGTMPEALRHRLLFSPPQLGDDISTELGPAGEIPENRVGRFQCVYVPEGVVPDYEDISENWEYEPSSFIVIVDWMTCKFPNARAAVDWMVDVFSKLDNEEVIDACPKWADYDGGASDLYIQNRSPGWYSVTSVTILSVLQKVYFSLYDSIVNSIPAHVRQRVPSQNTLESDVCEMHTALQLWRTSSRIHFAQSSFVTASFGYLFPTKVVDVILQFDPFIHLAIRRITRRHVVPTVDGVCPTCCEGPKRIAVWSSCQCCILSNDKGMCGECLNRLEVFVCPWCRAQLSADLRMRTSGVLLDRGRGFNLSFFLPVASAPRSDWFSVDMGEAVSEEAFLAALSWPPAGASGLV